MHAMRDGLVYLSSRIKFMGFLIYLVFLSSLSHFTFDQGSRRWLLCKRDECMIGETVSLFNFFSARLRLWRQVCRHDFFPIGLIITIDYLLVAITSNKIPNCLSAITINSNWLLFVTIKAFFLFLWLVFQEKQFFLLPACFFQVLNSFPELELYVSRQGRRNVRGGGGKCPSTHNLLHTFAASQKIT